jgi:hypothetical protein
MNPQHLSDEAVAAFADGVLSGSARDRAARHVSACPECRQAVQVQREAACALRTARAPELPGALRDRLRAVPMTTPITTLPTSMAPDGTTMLSTFAPMAALVPDQPHSRRTRPYITTAVILAMAGAVSAGSVARNEVPAPTGHGSGIARHVAPAGGQRPVVVNPVGLFRGVAP